jgi:predicted nucleic-acid-binding Zn-ribbon protein
MKTSEACPKCKSPYIIPDVRIRDTGQASSGALQVEVLKDPDALLFGKPVHSEMKAWICGSCGFTELYAEDPGNLWVAYKESLEDEGE